MRMSSRKIINELIKVFMETLFIKYIEAGGALVNPNGITRNSWCPYRVPNALSLGYINISNQ